MLGAIPSYYLHYFYCTDHELESQLAGEHRALRVLEIERELLAMYDDPALDHKPALLEQRGGAYYSEAAAALVTSLLTGDGAHHYVDVRNDGTHRRPARRGGRRGAGTRGPRRRAPGTRRAAGAGDAGPRAGRDRVRGAGRSERHGPATETSRCAPWSRTRWCVSGTWPSTCWTTLLAGQRRTPAGVRGGQPWVTARAGCSSPWTAATARPTSSSPTTGATCWPTCAAQAPGRTWTACRR